MAFGIDDLVSGGFNLAGGLMNNLFAGSRQNSAQAFNAQQAAAQMEFQERMSSTAHQREVQDLRAAGLNPILSVNHGASAPAGAMATTTPAPVHDIGLGAAVSTAMQSKRLGFEVANMDATNKNLIQSNINLKADYDKKYVEMTNLAADTAKKIAETSKTGEEEKITVQNLQKAIADSLEAKVKQGYFQSTAGQWLNTMSRGATDINKVISPVTSAVGAARGGAQFNQIMQDRWP